MIYVFDTNSVINYLWGNENFHENFETALLHEDEHDFIIPRVVDYELCRGFEIKPVPKKETMYKILTGSGGCCLVVDAGGIIWQNARHIYAELYRKRFTVGELDILIVAFCL